MKALPGNIVCAKIPGMHPFFGIYLMNVKDPNGISSDEQAKLLTFSGEFYTCHPSWLESMDETR